MSSSPPPSPSFFVNRFWARLVLVLTTLGVPIATIIFLSHFITEHPFLALLMGLLYEVGVFILGFLGKVWQRLESR